jgi:hypothetical protein
MIGVAALALLVASGPSAAGEVAIHLRLETRPHGTKEERIRVRDLEYELMARAAAVDPRARVRDAWNDGECVLTAETREAEALWNAMEEPVRAYGVRPGSYALVRAPGGRPRRIELPTRSPELPTRSP